MAPPTQLKRYECFKFVGNYILYDEPAHRRWAVAGRHSTNTYASFQGGTLCSGVTLEDVVAAKLGDVGVVGDEVVQEVSQLVALAQRHVGADQVLVNHSQVEVIAEGVHVHEVPHFVALFSEEH